MRATIEPASSTAGRSDAERTAAGEAARRRTFAVISHPDAGKSTLTEALALHARVIGQAGAVHGKAGRRGTVSDWMEMERDRGISITSAALQFSYRDAVVNLLDTPGHADFSEDTYRVLTAVDAAVMLIDAAKGLEAQTMKLFAVCRHRGIPIVTVVNKWDRPGKDALELMDEIAERTGLTPTPLTWPVGIAGDFRGVLDRRDGTFRRFTRTAGGATIAPEELLSAADAAAQEGANWEQAVEESELLAETGAEHDQELFLSGVTTPVLFASAVSNFGVGALLDSLVDLAPRALRRRTSTVPCGPLTSRSAPSCSRCSRAWTPRTATGWPTSASAPASSSGAWWSPMPPPAGRSPPSTPSTCSAGSARAWSWPTRATSSAW